MAAHVKPDVKAQIIADVPLRELADRAAAEGVSLIDYLHLIRSTVIGQMLAAAAVNDRSGTAKLAGRAVEVLQEVGRLTGELMRSAPVQNVTHNTAIFMQSPAFNRLEQMLLERLMPFPDAFQAVLAGLEGLEHHEAVHGRATLSLPPAEGFHAAAA